MQRGRRIVMGLLTAATFALALVYVAALAG